MKSKLQIFKLFDWYYNFGTIAEYSPQLFINFRVRVVFCIWDESSDRVGYIMHLPLISYQNAIKCLVPSLESKMHLQNVHVQ